MKRAIVVCGSCIVLMATGAYWHLSYTHRGKGHTQYIRDAFVPQVKAEVSNFKRFRKLIDRLITLSIERSQLRMKIDRKQWKEEWLSDCQISENSVVLRT